MLTSHANGSPLRNWRDMQWRLDSAVGLGLVVIAYVVYVAFLGLTRDYLGYGVETDFAGSFVPEAQRLLAGQPLLSTYHPPLYPVVLAVIYSLVQDWLMSGVLIALLSGITVIVASYHLFLQLCDRSAAWGALAILAASAPFLEHSIQATTDVFFFALFISSCALTFLAARNGDGWRYAAAGAVVALALFARTNGVPLLLLLLVPFTSSEVWRQRGLHLVQMIAGLSFVVITFVLFAALTGSNLVPTESYKFLAAQYFVEEESRLSGEALAAAEARFDGLLDVLLHDPIFMVTTYVSALYQFLARRIMELAQPPFPLLFLPGLVVLVIRHFDWRFGVFGLVVLAEFALVTLAPYSVRYYLFLVPVIGAGVGATVRLMIDQNWTPPVRSTLVTLLSMLFIAAVLSTALLAQARTYGAAREVAEAAPSARRIIEENAILVARKPAIALHVGAQPLLWPPVETLAELRDVLHGAARQQPLYLFYGAAEASRRGELAMLANPVHAPPWLHPVAQGNERGEWVLYRFGASEEAD